jgi:predicted small lipoprotein YifL
LLDGSGMKTTLVSIAVALALGALTGCDRKPNPSESKATPPPAGTGSSSATTPSTPANAGAPSSAEKKEGSNPVQGQVDPKQGEQHKDFQQKGAGAGPKPGG